MTRDQVKVLLLAGSGRSGSTVLANLLGSVDGAFSGGEIRYLWERGLRDDRLCGCGEPFGRCGLWTAVLDEAVGGAGGVDVERLIATSRRGSRIRHLPLMLLGQERRLVGRLDDYPARVADLYRAIATVTGCSLVIDSSKLPGYGYLLDRLDGIDLRVLHLVRDPRAAAYSWGRQKPLRDGAASATMEQQSPAKSAVLWSVWNAAAAALWSGAPERYLRLGYEEFVDRPRTSVARI
ncbi:MAG: sulfotransferase, partial [Acidimicrobiales bacterium]